MQFRSLVAMVMVVFIGACDDFATGVDGGGESVPSAVEVVTGDAQTAPANQAVADPPTVRVLDASGSPVPDETVVFAVASGGGSVTGETVTTDAEGHATVGGWTLGAVGAQSLTATVAGLDPVTFSATAVDACDYTAPYELGTTVESELTDADCEDSSGRYVEYYELQVDATVSLALTMESEEFPEFIGASDEAGTFVVTQYVASPGFTRAILTPGTYRMAARTSEAGVGGTYALTVSESAQDLDECDFDTFVTLGATASGQLTANDCTDQFGDAEDRVDGYVIRLLEGQTVTATLTSDAAGLLSLWTPDGHEESQGISEAGTVTISYTAPAEGWHNFYAISVAGTSYDISIEAGPEALDPCDETYAYTLGTTALGKLTANDCVDGGDRYVEFYTFDTDTQVEVIMEMGSEEFSPFIGAYDASGTFVVTQYVASPGFTRAVLAPGSYVLSPRSGDAGVGGFYDMTVFETSHDVDECGVRANVFVTAGVSVPGTITENDCVDEIGGNLEEHWDAYNIWLVEGQTVTSTVTLDGPGKLSLWNSAGENAAFQERLDAGTLTIDYTATGTGWHTLNPIAVANTGYEISFEATAAEGAAAMAPSAPRPIQPVIPQHQR